jgi:hypothetical protein
MKCGAGEGWRKSIGSIGQEMKKYEKESMKRGYPIYNK